MIRTVQHNQTFRKDGNKKKRGTYGSMCRTFVLQLLLSNTSWLFGPKFQHQAQKSSRSAVCMSTSTALPFFSWTIPYLWYDYVQQPVIRSLSFGSTDLGSSFKIRDIFRTSIPTISSQDLSSSAWGEGYTARCTTTIDDRPRCDHVTRKTAV